MNGAGVVCWRGNVSKIAASPYEVDGTGFMYQIDKFEDVLFLKEIETEAKIGQIESPSDWEKKCEYWGFKFETFILTEKGKVSVFCRKTRFYLQEPTPDDPVSTWEEMGAAFLTTFKADPAADEDELKVFYVAEIDGLDSQGKHVEVKTQAFKLFHNRFFSQKAMRWWIQSTIVDIEDVVVGFRDNHGIVFKLEKVNLKNLKAKCNEWSGNVCLWAVQHFFNQLRKQFDDLVKPGEMLVVERKPNSRDVMFSVIPKVEILNQEFRDFYGSHRRNTVKRKAEDYGLGTTEAKK